MSDLYEIDAASNRGIDDIRELREGVKTLPFESKYKVYIIDEAHMLTKEAWNALLKTLEEPPAHVLFVMATTEIYKVPGTILSRSEVYTFHDPSQTTLAGVVEDVASKEGYKIDRATTELVAMLGEGSFRDTLGVLQKAIGGIKGKTITKEDIEASAGVPKRDTVRNFLQHFIEKNSEKALADFRESQKSNTEPKIFLKLVLHLARMALLLKISKDSKDFVSEKVSIEEMEYIEELVKESGNNLNSKTLLALLQAYELVGKSPIPELGVEIAVSELLS